MGIRYYAWEITDSELAEARTDPWPVIYRADGRFHDPEWANIGLDKAWVELQRLLSDPRCRGVFEPRPAYEFFAGNVTYPDGYERGYEAHVGLLSATQVRTAQQDLATVTTGDVFVAAVSWGRSFCADYALTYLQEAQEFAADVTSRGNSMVYVIR